MIPFFDYILIISLLGQPSYKERVKSEDKLNTSAITYAQLKICNSLTGDPEVRFRLKRVAKMKWNIENYEKYEDYIELRDEGFKEDWKSEF